MDVPISQLPPGDIRLVDTVVNQLKSRGIFDKFRKECLADVDTKPAFQNLRQRVDGHVKKFLGTKTWKTDMNKNQIRDGVRKDIQESGILDAGIDAIINQVVNPKITPLILPYIEDTLYSYLQIEKPKREPDDDAETNIHHGQYNQNSMVYHGLPPHLQKNVYSDPPEVKPKIENNPMELQKTEMMKEEPKEQKSNVEVIPMATDAISSEEDDTLLCPNRFEAAPDFALQRDNGSDVKMEEDNAVDSFDSARIDSDRVAAEVGKLSIQDVEPYDNAMKSENVDHKSPTGMFDQQSLDSISSNSSNLSFSPQPSNLKLSGGKTDSADSMKDDLSMDELRSCQSTPLEDEKSASPQTSGERGGWSGSALPKDLPTTDRITVASFGEYGSGSSTPMVVSGASPISAESHSSLGTSPSKDTSATPLTEDSQDSISRQKLGLDEVSSCSSRHSTPKEVDSNSEKAQTSLKSTDDKSKRSSHSESRHKDSKHHKDRNISKSRDDHSSHRKKDKYRKDRDDDSDKDRRSKSRYHSSSSHHSSSRHKSKDGREKSSSHHSSHKSDRHGKSHKSDHHRSHSSREKSTRKDSKDKSKCVDSKDRMKSPNSSSNNKISDRKPNLSSPSNDSAGNSLLADKPSRSCKETDKLRQSNERISPPKQSTNLNDCKLKRNGSFVESKNNIAKENHNSLSNKIASSKTKVNASDSKSIVSKPKRIEKKLLALEEDITLMGNLNKKKKLETNNNDTKTMNKVDTIEVTSKIQKGEYKNGKKVFDNSTEHVKPTSQSIEENKQINKTMFTNGKRLTRNSEMETIKNVKRPKRKREETKIITNGLSSPSIKKKLRVSLEDISSKIGKGRKLQKTVNMPPENSQRLVIWSFNKEENLLDQTILDDSDDEWDFEGFEPPPKRIRTDPPDLFSDSETLVFDFEGFPDSSTSHNRVRSYLTRMKKAGNCSRYSD